jgi:hypothetical protein
MDVDCSRVGRLRVITPRLQALKAMFDQLAGVAAITRNTLGPVIRWLAVVVSALVLANITAVAQQPFVTIEGDLKSAAWWVVADFHPFTTEVRGIPANQIRKSWCKATEFRRDLIPKEILLYGGVDELEESKLSFSLEGHFDGSASTQIALVGVYEECSGPKGRFILILEQPTGGKPKIRFLDTVQTDRQFGALEKGDGNTIVAWACMECDVVSTLKWDRKKRKFDWVPQPDAP